MHGDAVDASLLDGIGRELLQLGGGHRRGDRGVEREAGACAQRVDALHAGLHLGIVAITNLNTGLGDRVGVQGFL